MMDLQFHIQDPTYSESYSLHEALLQACEGAIYGGGAYAFVSSGGAKLFLEDSNFMRFISSGTYKLIVGIDEITSENALAKLRELEGLYSDKLEAYAYYHDTKGSLFHPKFSWFRNDNGGVLILGSGNLTEKGLRRNREAFNVVEVDTDKITEIESLWNNWLSNNAGYLRNLDNSDVIDRVKENKKAYSRSKGKIRPQDEESSEIESSNENNVDEVIPTETTIELVDQEAWGFTETDTVLISEIPRSGNRWNQANFDKYSFINFFGARPGNNSLRVLLRTVSDEGFLGEIEVRPSVTVVSHNWRFELEIVAGVPYPDDGRPIGVFIRVSTRMFLYVVAMPGGNYYDDVKMLLVHKYNGRSDRMMRVITTVHELNNTCPTLPFWSIK